MSTKVSDPWKWSSSLSHLLDESFLSALKSGSEAPDVKYQKAIVQVLQTQGDLNFILPGVISSEQTSPSWSRNLAQRYFTYDEKFSTYLQNRYGLSKNGATTGHTMRSLQHDVAKGTLIVEGTVVGTLTASKVWVPRNKNIPTIKTEIKSSMEDWKNGYRPMGDETISRLKQYIRHGKGQLNEGKTVWHIEPSDAHAARVLDKQCATLDGYSMVSRLGKFNEADFRRLLSKKMDVRYLNYDITKTAFGRVLQAGLTNVSFVPCANLDKIEKSQKIEVGDVVCVLFGCSVPLILRPVSDRTYRVIDAIYVAGIMGGEFLEDAEDLTAQSFTLS